MRSCRARRIPRLTRRSGPAPRGAVLLLLLAGAGCGLAAPGRTLFPQEDGEPAASTGEEAAGTVDALCESPPEVEGDPGASDEQRAAAARLTCHRAAAGLAEIVLDPALNAAAQAHADYMDATSDYGHVESLPEHPAFTGEDALARALAAGYPVDLHAHSLEEVVAYDTAGMTPERAVDLWVDTVYHRRPLLHPLTVAVGIGIRGDYAAALLVGPWDTAGSGGGVEWSAYPGEGQEGVPTAFDSDRENPDPAPDHGVVGYPITASFAAGAWGADPSNPYDLAVEYGRCGLTDAEGRPVPVAFLDPAHDPYLPDTVALVPLEPLAPRTLYEATLSLSLAGEARELTWSFTTGGDDATGIAARDEGEPGAAVTE